MYCRKCGRRIQPNSSALCARCTLCEMSLEERYKLFDDADNKAKKKKIIIVLSIIAGLVLLGLYNTNLLIAALAVVFLCSFLWIVKKVKKYFTGGESTGGNVSRTSFTTSLSETPSAVDDAQNKNTVVMGPSGNIYKIGDGLFEDWEGNIIEWGTPFKDSKGYWVEFGKPFYDGRGYLCQWGSPFYDAGGNYIDPR